MTDYKLWLKGKGHITTSYQIMKHEDCQIVLIEMYPCNTKYELEARERYHIENTKCVTEVIPTRTKLESVHANIEQSRHHWRNYHNKNREERNAKQRDKYALNKDAINERHRE